MLENISKLGVAQSLKDSGVKASNLSNVMQKKESIDKKAKEFEAFFVSYIFQNIFKDIPKDSFMGGGAGEEVFYDQFIQSLAGQVSDGKGLGLSDQISDQISKSYLNLDLSDKGQNVLKEL